MCQIKAHEIHHGNGLDCRTLVSCSLEHHASDSKFWLVSTPILRENTLGEVRGFPPLSPSTNLARGLVSQRLFRMSPCRENCIHLQTFISSPGFKTRPYGTESASLTNLPEERLRKPLIPASIIANMQFNLIDMSQLLYNFMSFVIS
ncbi:hypothetical protein TNCV_140931 [Trichonephila clavipes]|nr:hypothetical protein TNCV_140931 [Trichonephila clavipes]